MTIVAWVIDFQISIKSLFDAKNEVYVLKLYQLYVKYASLASVKSSK